MKTLKIKIFLLAILIPNLLNGQDSVWYEFEFEDIKIDFPSEEVYQLDTTINGLRLSQLYAEIGNSTYVIQKLLAENNTQDKNTSSLPHNYESLIEYYEGVIEGAKNKTNPETVNKEEVQLGDLIGYKSVMFDGNENPLVESRTFLAGKDLIMLSVYNPDMESVEVKETFFKSLNVDSLNSLEQYTGQSKAYRQGYILGQFFIYTLIGVGIFFLLRPLIKKRKKKKKKKK